VAQNVFLAAHTALARFRGEASYRTWLFAIARKQCLKEIKHASRQQIPSLQTVETQVSPESVMLELEEAALWEQRLAQLSRLLQRLKKRERDVVMMYYYIG
jgi:RNA polymerase sigma-70 factor (ECF subfamily)